MGDKDVTQPDGFLRILPEFGGRSGQTEKGYGQGAPEVIVEVTGSTTARDLGKKKICTKVLGFGSMSPFWSGRRR